MLPAVTTLRDPLAGLLGAKTARKLADALGLHTAGDLLRHYPRRYHSRGELTTLSELREGEHVTVLAKVDHAAKYPMRPQRDRLEVTVTDGTDRLTLTFFGTVRYHHGRLRPGALGLFAGKVSTFRGRRQLVHPEYDLVPEAATAPHAADLAAGYATEIIPVYPASAKVSSWAISKAVGIVLDTLDLGEDPLPAALRDRYGLWPLERALRAVHRPADRADAARARERLRWDEAFAMQTALARRRRAAAAMPAVPRPPREDGLAAEFDGRLPFSLTEGQRRVGEIIARDLACAFPMNRLLQGEVGSGKTVVAVRAMLQVVDAGGQAVLLAPTEVLAQQHYRSITQLLGPLAAGGLPGDPPGSGAPGSAVRGAGVALLTGSTGSRARRDTLTDAFTGDAGILIGTHALLEDRVQFSDLGLVVIDEQHRFGVEQRDALREKATGARPHVLVMTATPIPRTVAMTVFGDLEVCTLPELPAGRSPVATHVVPALERPRYLERAWQRLREEVTAGRQAYVVCPRIGDEAAEGEDAAGEDGPPGRRPPLAVRDVAPALAEGPLRGLRLGVLHGRLHPDEKERVMASFKEGDVDVLVSTTVVEVGVDVPNATVMVIMDSDRFGVSQLHQLRGRVGRGREPGLCLLVTEAGAGTRARERLDAVAATADGFSLSRLDLIQRKEGDVLGAAQAGRNKSLRLLSLLHHEDLIAAARAEATALVAADPELRAHPGLAAAITDLLGPEGAEYLGKA
jgi:ATP-dependent DNA helicase RecG